MYVYLEATPPLPPRFSMCATFQKAPSEVYTVWTGLFIPFEPEDRVAFIRLIKSLREGGGGGGGLGYGWAISAFHIYQAD